MKLLLFLAAAFLLLSVVFAKKASMKICVAARLGTMDAQTRKDTLLVSDAWNGQWWHGMTLPQGRHHWTAVHCK